MSRAPRVRARAKGPTPDFNSHPNSGRNHGGSGHIGLASAPGLAYLIAFIAVPLALVLAYAFASRGPGEAGALDPTLDNFRRAADPLYLRVLWRSVTLAGATTIATLLIGVPAAWAVRAAPRSWQPLLLGLLVLPAWMNLLVKNYAWIIILRRQGVLNELLLAIGVIDAPLALLFTPWAVLIGLTHTFLPFMVLPVYAAMERLDDRMLEAARDLGAGAWATFRRIVLPQTRSGILAGCVLVFVPALGAFVTPDLLGGPDSLMVGSLIEGQLLQARDWPLAAALAACIMLLVLLPVALLRRGAPTGADVLR